MTRFGLEKIRSHLDQKFVAARALLEHSVDNLSPDEQAVDRPKLEALTVDLKRGDP